MPKFKVAARGKTTSRRFANAHRVKNILRNTTGHGVKIHSDGSYTVHGKRGK
jgi:hypothetical protein